MGNSIGAELPQNASDAEKIIRLHTLQKAQQIYKYATPETIAGIPFLEKTREMELERPRPVWVLKVNLRKVLVELNFFRHCDLGIAIGNLLKTVGAIFNDKLNLGGDKKDSKAIAQSIAAKVRSRPVTAGPSDFEETEDLLSMYRELYHILPLPNIASNFMEDRIFARLRVAGYNPMSLFAVTFENLPFRIPDSRMLPGDSIDRCIEERRLYALDFSVLGSIAQKRDDKKRFVMTKALFCVAKGASQSELIPLAIEMDMNQIVYPPSGETCNSAEEAFPVRWAIAKLAVNSCDAMHHEFVAHLTRTHLVVETFLIATMRQLAPTHPVYRLLRPHFEGTAFINEEAMTGLVARGGELDSTIAGDIKDIHEFISNTLNNLQFNDCMPDIDLKTRGLMNNNLHMPYREDALKHWKALQDWTAEYLAIFYKSNKDVTEDIELNLWVRELVEKCGVKKFGDGGTGIITSLDYLSRAVAYVIYSSSVQHAAVNYPQKALMSYPPAVPGHLADDYPDTADKDIDINTWVNRLPKLETAVIQVKFLSVLGGVYHTQLGKYRRDELPTTEGVKQALQRYQKKLKEIEKDIIKREANNTSGLKYEYMRPSRVPQSTNI